MRRRMVQSPVAWMISVIGRTGKYPA